jgi:Ala-tRNA(Pro) deacylase
MTLEKGRPQNEVGREERELRTYEFLDGLKIEYFRVDHAPALTMEDCVEIDKALGAPMCKNLFLCNRQQTDFYLLLMRGDKPFRTKELSAQLGVARLSFGKAEYMEKCLDITPGSLSVLGLMNDKENDVQLLIDEDVLHAEYIGCHPCINTSSLSFTVNDLKEKIIPALEHRPIVVKL